jgi:hypothetical protein
MVVLGPFGVPPLLSGKRVDLYLFQKRFLRDDQKILANGLGISEVLPVLQWKTGSANHIILKRTIVFISPPQHSLFLLYWWLHQLCK